MLAESLPKHYINPVYPRSFPDPFVIKFRGEYFAYCTDFAPDGRVFKVLRSRDLVNWTEVGGAMKKLDNDSPFYWAPEVFYLNGKFYLYYSVGNEAQMEIRVAVSDRPDGGFADAGHRLTTEEFAIDAHVFTDPNGGRYLFYATDFLDHTHIGTGTVVDKMLDPFTLEGQPKPVTRAKYDWQIYDPNRAEKGGVRWHTVEGPTVLKRKKVYYEMFSGGNWQNTTYGVSFAVADNIEQTEEWQQFSDGEKVFPILRTIPELIVGPGHNSVVRGLNNRELYCIYHRWTENGRVLAIDRMDFAGGNRIFINGATHTPQPAPYEPSISDFFDKFSAENWQELSGEWRAENNQLLSAKSPTNTAKNEIVCREKAESFICEVSLKASENADGEYGIHLKDGSENVLRILLSPPENCITVAWFEQNVERYEIVTLSNAFDFRAFHLLRVEVDKNFVNFTLDESAAHFERILEKSVSQISLVSEDESSFSGFSLTAGFEELFENVELKSRGWNEISLNGEFYVKEQCLNIKSQIEKRAVIVKEVGQATGRNYELAVNFCLKERFEERCAVEFHPVYAADGKTPYFLIENENDKWYLKARNANEIQKIALPENFASEVFQQIRFVKFSEKFFVMLESQLLVSIEAPRNTGKIALAARGAVASFEMVRMTFL